jgi:hypothetical protein
MVKKSKNLSTVKIQTCFQILNVNTKVTLLFFLAIKIQFNFHKSIYPYFLNNIGAIPAIRYNLPCQMA